MKRSDRRKGFTLVEILVVILIITMLATLVTPNIFRQFSKAKVGLARTGIANLENALSEFLLDCGRFPTQAEGLLALRNPPSDLVGRWDGPYVKESELYDPWRFPFDYRYPAAVSENEYDIISYGADGAPGGEGANADIYNV